MVERRRHKRWSVSVPCTIEWKEYVIEGQIANFSLGGAFVTRVDALPPGEAEVSMKFRLEQENVFMVSNLSAKVVHTKRNGVARIIEGEGVGSFGVQFLDASERGQELIQSVLKTLILDRSCT